MANYPQLDNASGVWNLREVYDAVMGGYWPNANNRAIVAGGFTPSYTSTIEHFSMITSGDSTLFGDLSNSRGEFGAMSNFTRCIFAGGNSAVSPNSTNIIDYVQFNTTGNAADFGDLGAATYRSTGTGGNATRGIVTEGNSDGDQLQFITPTTLGSAIDFGNRTVSGTYVAGVTSPTRVCFGGAFTPSVSNIIDFVEIATTGNAVDFGDLSNSLRDAGGCSSSTRGVFIGGLTPTKLTTLDFITIASQGNATDYGDLTTAARGPLGLSNSVKGIYAGGTTPTRVNTIQTFVINNGGTATDFGDLISVVANNSGNSAAHGGLNNGYEGTRPLPFNEAGGDLGLYFGGEPASSPIQFINISSTGNANDFSGVTVGAIDTNGGGNKTRGMIYSGNDGSGNIDDIKYVEFATKGNVAFFGNATAAKQIVACASNNTRLLAGGGATPSNINNIDQITIGTLGNAADFGDLTASRKPLGAGSSNTRAVWGGGNNPDPTNVMDYVTISTAGNAADFGDLSVARRNGASANSTTRILFAGGRSNPSPAAESNVIDYITTATTGNATDFGDLTSSRLGLRGVSNTTRGCFMGGTETPGGNVNIIDFVTIGSTGNASDFGDIIAAGRGGATASNGHGGLIGG
jgi:hypothetical protein